MTNDLAGSLEDRARAEARRLVSLAGAPGAGEIDRVRAETATAIVSIAELRAGVVPAHVLSAAISELRDWEGDRIDEAIAAVLDRNAKAVAAGLPHITVEQTERSLKDAVSPAIAALDMKREQFQADLADYSVAAWSEALAGLRALDRPMAGPARH